MANTHILLVDGSGGKDDGDNNRWIYNDTLAFYQLFRSYGYSPDILTSRPPPSTVLLYGNPPIIFYHPDDETAPTSTWTTVDPLEIRTRLLQWLNTTSAAANKNDKIVLGIFSHGSAYGSIQLGTYTEAQGLHKKNSMASLELFEHIRDKFQDQHVYVILDYCFAGSAASDIAPSFFKANDRQSGAKTIIHSSAYKISFSNRWGNGSMFSTEMVKSFFTRPKKSKRTILQQAHHVMSEMKMTYGKEYCTPTINFFPPKLSTMRERDFVFTRKHSTNVDYNSKPDFIPTPVTKLLERTMAILFHMKYKRTGFKYLKSSNHQCMSPFPGPCCKTIC